MSILDGCFIAILVISSLIGAWRGLIFEVLSLVSWLAAFVLAQWFAPAVGQWLPIHSSSEVLRYGLGFVLVFVATVFAGSLIAFVVKKLVSAIGLQPADRMLGALFGVVRGCVVLLAITVVMCMTPLTTSSWWQESMGARIAQATVHGLKPVLPEEFGKYLP